jgi:large subunit ribosomal protein L25
MNRIELTAELRAETGKGPARRARMAGKTPAVFYGKKTTPLSIALDCYQLTKALEKAGGNPLFDLTIRRDGGTEVRTGILKAKQIKPTTGAMVHLDFIEVFMDEVVEVTVRLEFVGKSIGVEKGGMFQIAKHDMRIACLPDRIPEAIKVDISNLDVGHSIHVGDVVLPSGVEAVMDKGLALATILAATKDEETAETPAKES